MFENVVCQLQLLVIWAGSLVGFAAGTRSGYVVLISVRVLMLQLGVPARSQWFDSFLFVPRVYGRVPLLGLPPVQVVGRLLVIFYVVCLFTPLRADHFWRPRRAELRKYALLYMRVGARLGLATGHRSEFIALPVRLVLFGRQLAIGSRCPLCILLLKLCGSQPSQSRRFDLSPYGGSRRPYKHLFEAGSLCWVCRTMLNSFFHCPHVQAPAN